MTRDERIPDEELWEIFGDKPPSPEELARDFRDRIPRSGWSASEVTISERQAWMQAWIAWAKYEIQSAGDDLELYLCRVVRLLESFRREVMDWSNAIKKDDLEAVMVSGLVASGADFQNNQRLPASHLAFLATKAISDAEAFKLITMEDVDEWHPGMATGSGWKRYVRLTLAGRRLTESQDDVTTASETAETGDDVPEESSVQGELAQVGGGEDLFLGNTASQATSDLPVPAQDDEGGKPGDKEHGLVGATAPACDPIADLTEAEAAKLERGAHESDVPPAPPAEQKDDTNRYANLDKMEPSVRKAYYSFLYAEAKNEKLLEDREAYYWLQEYGIDSDDENSGELVDYELPVFESWTRYLRNARKLLGEQKYTPRHTRPTGGSIVGSHKI